MLHIRSVSAARRPASRCGQNRLAWRRKEPSNGNKRLQEPRLAFPRLNEFLSAFSAATGVPLSFLKAGRGEVKLLKASRLHSVGTILVSTEPERSRWVQGLKKLISGATADGFAEISASIGGLNCLAMPLHGPGSFTGILLVGPMFPRTPRPCDLMGAAHHPAQGSNACHGQSARSTYLEIPVVPAARLDALIRLISMFTEYPSKSARLLL